MQFCIIFASFSVSKFFDSLRVKLSRDLTTVSIVNFYIQRVPQSSALERLAKLLWVNYKTVDRLLADFEITSKLDSYLLLTVIERENPSYFKTTPM